MFAFISLKLLSYFSKSPFFYEVKYNSKDGKLSYHATITPLNIVHFFREQYLSLQHPGEKKNGHYPINKATVTREQILAGFLFQKQEWRPMWSECRVHGNPEF